MSDAPTHETISLENIRTEGDTQSRAEIRDHVVKEYADMLMNGQTLPPPVVFADGKHYWLADGFHRFHAYQYADIEDVECEVHRGTRRDAILYSVGANETHGVRRSNEDRREAVRILLSDDEWSQWSDRAIARQAAVSNTFVSTMRKQFKEERTVNIDSGDGSQRAERTDSQDAGRDAASPATSDAGIPHDEFEDDDDPPPSGDRSDSASSDGSGGQSKPQFTDVTRLVDGLQKQIQQFRKTIKNQVAETPAATYLNRQQVDTQLKNVWKALSYAKPHAVCPDCEGAANECATCRATGFLPKPYYEQVTKQREDEPPV